MQIKGFIDLSLVDWDGHVTSVIFLPYCNFRCPYCHNSELVLEAHSLPNTPLNEVLDYLENWRGFLDGVVITGGEPTLHKDLPKLCETIKEIGLSLKVDTNGSNPEMIKHLIDQNLVDYIALDIKAPLSQQKYTQATGVDASGILTKIRQTLRLLIETQFPHEIRTTVVPTLHTPKDIAEIAKQIRGCQKYVIQNFKPQSTLNPAYMKLKPFTNTQLQEFLNAAKKVIENVKIRP